MNNWLFGLATVCTVLGLAVLKHYFGFETTVIVALGFVLNKLLWDD